MGKMAEGPLWKGLHHLPGAPGFIHSPVEVFIVHVPPRECPLWIT